MTVISNAREMAILGDTLVKEDGLQTILASAQKSLTTRLDVTSLLRQIARTFFAQYVFKNSAGADCSVPQYQVWSSVPFPGLGEPITDENKNTVIRLLYAALQKLRQDMLQREGELLMTIAGAAASVSVDVMDGCGRPRAYARPSGPGLPTRTIAADSDFIAEAHKDMTDRGTLVTHIVVSPRDYAENVMKKHPVNDGEFTRETRRSNLMRGILAYYRGATVMQSRFVAPGTIQVFGGRTPEEIATEPNHLDLVLAVRQPLTLRVEKDEQGTTSLVLEEVIGVSAGWPYLQRLVVA